jgi:arsenite methyltransferase
MAERRSDEVIREAVRERYAAAATEGGTCVAQCCGPDADAAFGARLYTVGERAQVPAEAALVSLGCGNPTSVADLTEGEVVLDLGSGGGLDVLLAARLVGPGGKVYGLDMTDEMLALARRNAERAGVANVEWLHGAIEEVPLPERSVDVVISNCVINLAAEKGRVFREAARVLRPGGRVAITDIVADPEMDEATRRDLRAWTGCIAGALTRADLEALLELAGLVEIEILETHRVHERAGSAVIRARKPSEPGRALSAGTGG